MLHALQPQRLFPQNIPAKAGYLCVKPSWILVCRPIVFSNKRYKNLSISLRNITENFQKTSKLALVQNRHGYCDQTLLIHTKPQVLHRNPDSARNRYPHPLYS